jgi:DNA polymerase elongation subunit (family B)
MPLYKAASPVAVTEALMVRKLSELNLKVAIEWNKSENEQVSYTGAYVKEPERGYYQGVSAFDFASLYPSIMRQFNISPDSFIKLVPKSEIKKAREDKNTIVCENGVIYKKQDSILKQILSDLYSQRKDYKKLSYDYFTKAEEIKKFINKKINQ